MLDRDLAELYVVETKYLKRQVKRNIERFPEDFMFELSKEEFEEWRSQNVTSKSSDTMGLRYAPYAFTEQGLAMLSSVLNSQRAIACEHPDRYGCSPKCAKYCSPTKTCCYRLRRSKARPSKNSRDIKAIFAQLRRMREEEQEPVVTRAGPQGEEEASTHRVQAVQGQALTRLR